MREIAFFVAVLGIGVLLYLLVFGSFVEVESIEDLTLNSKVVFEGVVSSERDFGDFKILNVNGIDVVCNFNDVFIGKYVRVKGNVGEYEGRKQVNALEIVVLEDR